MANVVYLHGQPQRIAQIVRIGTSGHRRLEQMLASGSVPVGRFVVDAAVMCKQSDLVTALKQGGLELTLDTNVAELSSIGRFQGAAKGAPWADPRTFLTPAHFRRGANESDIVGQIARFAITHNVQRVLAPSHLLTGIKDTWFAIDVDACVSLRRALDIEGGQHIAIDYPLMIPNAILNDAAERKALSSTRSSAPLDSLWLRISGFGAAATPVGLRKYIMAAQDFRELQKPIIADGVGGMAGLAITAFGATSGVTHGIAERERFDATDWNKPPRKGGGGGGYNVLVPGIDRLLTREEAEALLAAPSARRLASCQDRTCCPNGFEDTMRDPKGHYLRQRAKQLAALSSVPEQTRARHFLDVDLANADRTARQISKLKIGDRTLTKMLNRNAERLDRMRDVLEDLHKTIGVLLPPPEMAAASQARDSQGSHRTHDVDRG